jgi:hypothetical protein
MTDQCACMNACVYSPSEPNTGCSRCVVLLKVPRVDYSRCQKNASNGIFLQSPVGYIHSCGCLCCFYQSEKGVCLVGMFKTNSGCKGMCFI